MLVSLAPLVFLLLGALCAAKTVTYDFDIGYVTANPDGQFDRKTIGINGQWPIPTIAVDLGDRLVVNIHNSLDIATALHFHGLYMKGAVEMDGPAMVTQCPVPPGGDFTYDFIVGASRAPRRRIAR